MDLTQLPIESTSLLGVGHDDLIEQEFPDDVLVDRVLLELKVVIVDRLTLNNLVIVGWVIQLFEERMLKDLSGSESFSRIVGEQL